MSTTTCRVCHSPLGPDEVYCRRCGAQVGPTTPADAPAYAAAAGAPPAPSGPVRDLASLSPALAGAVPAPVGRRIGAGAIDGVLGGVLGLVVYGLFLGAHAAPVALILLLGVDVLFWWWNATTGLTVGRSATGLRLVAEDTGAAPGWGRAFGRNLVVGAFSGLTCGALGWLPLASILWDGGGRNRGWHDKWSRTVVVDIRLGRDPMPPATLTNATAAASAPPFRGSEVAMPLPFPAAPEPPSPAAAAGVPSPVAGSPAILPPPPPPPSPSSVTAEPASRTVPVVPAAPSTPPTPTVGVISAVPGVMPPPPAPPAPEPAGQSPVFRSGHPAAPPTGAVLADEDEHTVMRRPRRLGAVTLAFDTGERIGLTHGQGVVGREPQPRAGEQVEHVVPIDDPDRSVSKTHLSFGIDGRGFWVLDRGSTNGTRVLHGDVELAEVGQDEPTYVAVGDVVEFGDRRFVVQRD